MVRVFICYHVGSIGGSGFVTLPMVSTILPFLSSSSNAVYTGGHFVPAVAHKIFVANIQNSGQAIPINLQGLGIGNGMTGKFKGVSGENIAGDEAKKS